MWDNSDMLGAKVNYSMKSWKDQHRSPLELQSPNRRQLEPGLQTKHSPWSVNIHSFSGHWRQGCEYGLALWQPLEIHAELVGDPSSDHWTTNRRKERFSQRLSKLIRHSATDNSYTQADTAFNLSLSKNTAVWTVTHFWPPYIKNTQYFSLWG